MSTIRVSLDGGNTWQEVAEVRVESPEIPESDVTVTLTIHHEGVIQDVWRKGGDEENLHTGCLLWEDIVPGVLD